MYGLHLAQALETGDVGLAPELGPHDLVFLGVVLGVLGLAALADAVERRLGQEEVAVLDQLWHLAIEEGHQQRGDVGAVDVGIGHDDDAFVAQSVIAVARTGTAAQGLYQVLDLLVVTHLLGSGTGHVQDLAPQRQDGLRLAVARGLGRAACRIALDQEYLGAFCRRVAAVGKLAGEAQLARRRLTLLLAVLLAADALLGLGDDMLEQDVAGFLVAGQPVLEIVADDRLNELCRLDADQFLLGLALELRLFDEDRDQARGAVHHVVGGNDRALAVAGEIGVALQAAQQGTAEARFVRSAFRRGHRVAVGADEAFLVVRPPHRPFDLAAGRAIALALGFAREGGGHNSRPLADFGDEIVLEAAREVERLLFRNIAALEQALVALPADLDAAEQVRLRARHLV